jgi:nucleoside-diphosphate-sugar epimerase
MRVLVTGGTGTVGPAVVERLVRHGWEVRVIGLGPQTRPAIAGVEYQLCDITNYAELREQMRGCQLVIHLAAIASPTRLAGPELFQINVAGTYNVFEAAVAEGVRRIVQASSINAFGCFWGNVELSPQYLPIDEAHPTYTTDPYSFSKSLIEEIGAYYWRRDGISSLAYRLPGVWPADWLASESFRQSRREIRAVIDEYVTQPAAVQQARLATIRAQTVDFRRQKRMEYPLAQNGLTADGFSDDPLWPVYAFDRFNFWAFIDERDSAQAFEQGLTAAYEGSHVLFVNAPTNSLDYDSTTLARLFFPEVRQMKRPLTGAETLVSIAKAKDLLGFAPEYAISNL